MGEVETRFSGSRFDDDAIDAGVRAGIARAARHELLEFDASFNALPAAVQEPLGSTIQVLREVLLAETAVAPSWRAVALFAELSTVAAVARSNYQEPPLTRDEIEAYMQQTADYENSFWHA
jgi:hypothetical protein